MLISLQVKVLNDIKENTDNSEQYMKDQEKKLPDKINLPYEIRRSLSFVNKKDSMQHLYGKPDIVCSADDYSYEIRDMDDESKLFVFYDKDGIVRNIWRLKKLFNREEFNQINIGKSTGDDVKNIDPYCVIANGSKKMQLVSTNFRNHWNNLY